MPTAVGSPHPTLTITLIDYAKGKIHILTWRSLSQQVQLPLLRREGGPERRVECAALKGFHPVLSAAPALGGRLSVKVALDFECGRCGLVDGGGAQERGLWSFRHLVFALSWWDFVMNWLVHLNMSEGDGSFLEQPIGNGFQGFLR